MKKLIKHFRYGEKGFTLVELLVVVAILGVLAAVAVPNVGSFIGKGKSESYAAELHNIQTAVMALLADSTTGALDDSVVGGPVNANPTLATATADMDLIKTTDTPQLVLSSYMSGLNTDGTVRSGCTYRFGTDGTVLQTTP